MSSLTGTSKSKKTKLKNEFLYSCFKNKQIPIVYLKKNGISGSLLNAHCVNMRKNKITESCDQFAFDQVYDETSKFFIIFL